MKKLFERIIALLIFLVMGSCTIAQPGANKLPAVGQKCPEFRLTDVRNYKKKAVELCDFKGRWLVLDCWNRWCGACINSFPKIDSMQRQFQDVQFILIGYTGSQYMGKPDNLVIKDFYAKLKKKHNLNTAVAFDSTFFHNFDVGGCPHIIIVDPNGIVRAITYKITSGNIQDLINGREVQLPPVTTLSQARKKRKLATN